MRFERGIDETVHLPPEAQEELIRWCEILVADGYDLDSPNGIWESAAYLVANDYTEDICPEEGEFLNVGETACILTFAAADWSDIKRLLTDGEDNGAWDTTIFPSISDSQNLQLFTLLSAACFTLLLAYVVSRVKQQKL